METSHSAVDCSSSREDDDASPRPVPLVVGTESSSRMMAYGELHEILSWMLAKSAIKYSSSLCKWLCNIHLDPRFIKKQCIHSCGQDSGFFLQHVNLNNDRVSNEFEFHVLPWETVSAFGFPLESLDYLPKSRCIVSSSNGLLLLRDLSLTGSYELKLCNPATREWAPLPIPEGFKGLVDEYFSPLIECCPWGLDNVEFPNDYTIAVPVTFRMSWRMVNGFLEKIHNQKLLIYSDGRWEEELCDINIEGRIVRFDMPVAVFSNATKGVVVHYLCDSGKPGTVDPGFLEPYIAAFNIREKKLSREIKLPEGAWAMDVAKMYVPSPKKLWIFKWKETSICLVRWWVGHSRMVAWVLDDYGCEGECWSLVMDTSERELWPNKHGVGRCIMSVGVADWGKGLLIATAPANFKKVPPRSAKQSGGDVFSRVYVYLVEGEDRGRLEVVGEHQFGFEHVSSADDALSLRFLPYANTLRPVLVQNTETRTY